MGVSMVGNFIKQAARMGAAARDPQFRRALARGVVTIAWRALRRSIGYVK